jgi:hypothetical protein
MRLVPVVGKCSLRLGHGRSCQVEARVPPMFGGLRVALPLSGDPYASREADPTVNEQDLAMRATVHPVEVIPAQRTIPTDGSISGKLLRRLAFSRHGLYPPRI